MNFKNKISSLIFLGLFLINKSSAQVPSYVPTDSLIGWWPFDGTAKDISGNGNNGSVNGATLTTDRYGKRNSAYYCSSSGCATRIDIDNLPFSSTQKGLTIAFWIYKSGNGCINPRIFEFWGGWGATNGFGIGWLNSNNYDYLNTKLNSNVWYHITHVLDGDSLFTYLNGNLDDTRARQQSFPTASDFALGRMNHSAWDAFNGKFDELGIWEKALNTSEINNLYQGLQSEKYDTLRFCNSDTLTIGLYTKKSNTTISCNDTLESQNFNNNGRYIPFSRTTGSDSIFVSNSGNDNTGSGTKSAPYKTISKAINNASNGEVIYLLDGTYKGWGNTNITTQGKQITIEGYDGAGDVVIDGENTNRFLVVNDGETNSTKIRGLSIINCVPPSTTRTRSNFNGHGGAIYVGESSGLSIENCYFFGNTYTIDLGHREAATTKSTLIKSCVFEFNNKKIIYGDKVTFYVDSCIFQFNNGTGLIGKAHRQDPPGGFVFNIFRGNHSEYQTTVTGHGNFYQNCLFYENKAGRGVIYHGTSWSGTPMVDHCTFYNNCVNKYTRSTYDHIGTTKNSIFDGITDNIYKHISGNQSKIVFKNNNCTGISSNGNFSGNPRFKDSTNFDFGLQTGSPCIGADENGNNVGANYNAFPNWMLTFPYKSNSSISQITKTNTKYKWSTGDTTSFIYFGTKVDTTLYLTVDSAGYKIRYHYTLLDSCKCNNPIVKIGTSDTIKACGKDTIQLNASSGFKSYQWSNSDSTQKAVISSSGLVSIKAIDSLGCIAYDTTLVSILNPKISPSDTLVCSGDTLDLSVSISSNQSGNSVQSRGTIPTDSLVAWLPFDGNVKDSSGNNYDGLSYNISHDSDRFGGNNSAVRFDINSTGWGTAKDRINIKYSDIQKALKRNNEFTISCWVNIEQKTGSFKGRPHSILGIWDGDGSPVMRVQVRSNKAHIQLVKSGGNILLDSDSSLTFNQWTHITYVFNKTNFKFYINGLLAGNTSSINWTYPSTTATITLGEIWMSNGHWYHFNGRMDDLAIWNRALTNSEITTLYSGSSNSPKINWSTGDTTESIKYSTTGTNKVWVTVSDGIGSCSDTTTISISNPKFEFSQDTVLFTQCSRDSLKISAPGQWSNFNWNTGSSDSFVYASDSGFYKVTLKDSVGCVVSDSFYFINPGAVVANLVATDSVDCYLGADGSINTSISGGFAPYTYQWDDASAQTTANASNLKKGTYKLIAKDIYGCSDSVTATIHEPAKVSITSSTIDSVNCYLGSDGSIATTTGGGSGGYTYLWNDASSQTTATASNLKKGTYKLIVKDIYGCSDSASYAVQEPTKVSIIERRIKDAVCYGYADGEIWTQSQGGTPPYNYLWNSSPPQFTFNATNLLAGDYKLIVKDIYGCSDSTEATINEPEEVIPTIVEPLLTMKGMNVKLNVDVDPIGPEYYYQWEPVDIFKQFATNSNPVITLNEATDIKVTVTNQAGCIGKDSITMQVIQPLSEILPNAITPNGDGLNDIFKPNDYFELLDLKIYNRWGQMVYESQGSQLGWDGTFAGEKVPAGVYVYVIQVRLKYTDQVISHSSNITILK